MIRARNDVVVLERLPRPDRTSGGLYLPSGAAQRPQLATVLSAGPRAGVREGEVVMFPLYENSLQTLYHDGREVMVVRGRYLLAAVVE